MISISTGTMSPRIALPSRPVSKATHRNTKRPSSSSQRSARSSQLKRAVNAQGQELRPALALGALAGLEFGVGFGHGVLALHICLQDMLAGA